MVAFNDGEVEREVMTLEAPGPGGFVGGVTKYGHVIKLRIADGVFVFQIVQDLFERHYSGGLEVALVTKSAAEEGMSKDALTRGHLFHRDAITHFCPFDEFIRDEVPAFSFVVFPLESGFFLLSIVKGRDQEAGGVAHVRAGGVMG